MVQQVEIEFKNLLTENEFIKLKKHFNILDDEFIKQTNYYFDTTSFSLAKRKSSLRVRTVQKSAELTLKQPHPSGLLETNEDILIKSAQRFINESVFPVQAAKIKTILTSQTIPLEELIYLGELTTFRAEFAFAHGLIALDHSCYLNKQDFEIEYEVTNEKSGKQTFDLLLQQLKIPRRETKSKIQRFIEEKALKSKVEANEGRRHIK